MSFLRRLIHRLKSDAEYRKEMHEYLNMGGFEEDMVEHVKKVQRRMQIEEMLRNVELPDID